MCINYCTGVDKPNPPEIMSVSETTIWAIVPMTWKDEYEGIPIFYSFVIQVIFTIIF
jgi:hypothetical protein